MSKPKRWKRFIGESDDFTVENEPVEKSKDKIKKKEKITLRIVIKNDNNQDKK